MLINKEIIENSEQQKVAYQKFYGNAIEFWLERFRTD